MGFKHKTGDNKNYPCFYLRKSFTIYNIEGRLKISAGEKNIY